MLFSVHGFEQSVFSSVQVDPARAPHERSLRCRRSAASMYAADYVFDYRWGSARANAWDINLREASGIQVHCLRKDTAANLYRS